MVQETDWGAQYTFYVLYKFNSKDSSIFESFKWERERRGVEILKRERNKQQRTQQKCKNICVALSWCDFKTFEDDGFGVDSHVFCRVVRFVDSNQAVSHLEHVVPQGDDDELSVLGLFLSDKR